MMYTILGSNNKSLEKVSNPNSAILNEYHAQIEEQTGEQLKNEFFEIVNKNGVPTGELKLRDLVHREGDWHKAMHLHVFSREGPTLLLQKRSQQVDYPGCFDTFVGGHFAIGETNEDVLREAEEEVGLSLELDDVVQLGVRRETLCDGKFFNQEVQVVFVFESDQQLSEYNISKKELAGIYRVDVQELIELLSGKRDSLEAKSYEFRDDEVIAGKTVITSDDKFWPHTDDYMLKVCYLICRVSRGKKIPDNPFEKKVSELE